MEIAGGQDDGAEAARFVHRYQQRGDHATTGQPDGLLLPEPFDSLETALVELEIIDVLYKEKAAPL